MSDPATQLDTIKNAAARRQLAKLGQLVRQCQQTMKETKMLSDVYRLEMGAIAEKLGLSAVDGEDWTLFKKKGSRRLDRKKLLELGVKLKVIEDSMTTGKDSWSVRGKGSSGEEEEDEG